MNPYRETGEICPICRGVDRTEEWGRSCTACGGTGFERELSPEYLDRLQEEEEREVMA